ncbi:MAG: DUF2905 domain-containing protein [Candidatus Omnitrophica bacterium]|nr:DUF2905 domain-containing protein [Candidatus Omnitrophota bacterium]
MFSLESIGRILVFFGIMIIFTGLLFILFGKIPHLSKLPGNIEIHKKGLDIYFPLAASLIISLILTLVLNIFIKHK